MNRIYMTKLITALKRFNHYGYDQEDYDISRYKMLCQAYDKCVLFTNVFHIIMGVFSVLSCFRLIRIEMLPEYLGFFTILSMIRVYYHFCHDTSARHYAGVCRLSISLLLFFGLIESLSDLRVVATAMLALFIVTATVFADSMLTYIVLCFVNVGLLIASSRMFKSEFLAMGDTINAITFGVVAVAIHYIVQRERLEYHVTSAQLQKLREEQLESELSVIKASNDAKSLFLSKMSHEIRTPINAILGMNEMIIREYDDEQLNEYTANIQSSGETLLTIVNDILDFSKIEAKKMEIIPVRYELSTLINDIVTMIKVRAQKKDIEIIVNVSPEIPNYLYGDDIRIKQCILNILTNAVKYTDRGSVTLEVNGKKTSEDEVYIRFRSIDTGIGMKKEDLQKLYSPFERIEENRNRTIEGTGLGMNIVKNLLALMDATLEVSSVYGKGTTAEFEIRQVIVKDIPIGDFTETYKENLRNKDVKHTSFISPQGRILVIDDNSLNLTVITGLLKETRLQVDTASSGLEGIKKVCETEYDCVFVDHLMPHMDGIETLQKMRESEDNRNKSIPYIALTANAINGAREEYLSAGFDDYLSKPINIDLLEKMLIRYLPADKVILPGDEGFTESLSTPKKLQGFKSEDSGSEQPQLVGNLNSLKGIELKAALDNTGSTELLRTVITEYRDHIPENAERIETFFKEQNWNDFTISVHALKSTSRVIGALELSEMCQKLETAGKEQDTDTINSLTAPMLELYRSYVENLSFPEELEGQNTGETESIEKTKDLSDVLTRTRSFLEDYDYDSAESVLKELDDSELTEDIKEKLQNIKEALSNLDAEIGIEIIDSIL
ncbi:signal transduction histidine kinase [Lachnospiraceae bacterium JC7]|nr:signal transduction histidine kinase [Lachnospiraceae bacterium JC7]